MILKHTPEFDLAYRFITETNLNIFLTGKAGTGKTTFLRNLRETTLKRMAIAAPTGVAAINAGGVTLHSLFQLPFGPFIPGNAQHDNAVNEKTLLGRLRYNREKINFIHNLELLVIDEVSMVSSYLLDEIEVILRSVRRKHNLPFGGVQVLLIGDLYQLQPVVKKEEWQLLKNYYSSIFFFDSHVFRNNPPLMIELKEIFRQKDEEFVSILNQIRNNNLEQGKIDILNSRLKRNFNPDENEGYITLTTHNDQARAINERKLSQLKSEQKVYTAKIENDFPEQMFPCEVKLTLKAGAQVMFTKNDNDEKKYFNGKIGVVISVNDESVSVKCDEEIIIVEERVWENIRYSTDESTHKIKEETLGIFRQIPLRLAWAITIHKSQGLTFKKLVVDAENAFANGQVYVALSRATSLEGLVLTSPLNRQFLGAHTDLRSWQEKNTGENDLEKKFTESRNVFCRNELAAIFNFSEWQYTLNSLSKEINGLNNPVNNEVKIWLSELLNKQKELFTTANKFTAQIFEYCNTNPAVEQNEMLQERIIKGSEYFIPMISRWNDQLKSHTVKLNTRRESRVIDELINDVYLISSEILFKLGLCKNGFVLNNYLADRRKMDLKSGAINTTYESKKSAGDVSVIDAEELYNSLNDFRMRMSDEEDLPLYRVFSNQTMKLLCEELPGNEDALLNISGFGKKKVLKFGKEVIRMVNEYCTDRGKEPNVTINNYKNNSRRSFAKPSVTVDATLALFRRGKTIAEICSERGLVISTIENHLAQAIEQKKIKVEEVLSEDEIKTIKSHFPENIKHENLYEYSKTLPEGVSYNKVKMVMAGMRGS